jgi:hypothetical protein
VATLKLALTVCLMGLLPSLARSNDAAAEVAAGGLQLRAEPRVAMAKERLFFGLENIQKKTLDGREYLDEKLTIRVEYEFVNRSKEGVTLEVAFPVPPLSYRGESTSPTSTFDDFRVWVDGGPVVPKKEVRALLHGRDVSGTLKAVGVSIEDFGRFNHEDDGAEFKGRLDAQKLAALVRDGLVDGGDVPWPRWEVAVTYHWTQIFPAGRVVRVRHEYTPAYGHEQARMAEVANVHKDGCFNRNSLQGVRRRMEKDGDYVGLTWVKYILTTANTWQTPIEDFEVVIERPEGKKVSFCWVGKVERVGKTRFRATARNFVPKSELVVYFY